MSLRRMSLWRQLSYGLRSLFSKADRDREVADEVEQYFEEATAAWMARGRTLGEARRAARLEAGSMTAARAQARSYGWENGVSSLMSDLRFAARQLRKHPGFTATATLTLALGIGANTAIFTVIESVLLAPLPYKDAGRIAVLNTHWTDSGHTSTRVTGGDAVAVRDQAKGLAAVSLFAGGNEGVQLRDHATYTEVTWVDENFARVFSLQPVAGRLFTDEESHRAALVSEMFARDNFGGAQAAVGQVLHVETEAIEIVGVLRGGFDFPEKTQVWEAMSQRPESMSHSAFNYRAVALLSPGTSLTTAQAELDGLSRRLETAFPADNRNKQMKVLPLAESLTGNVRPTLLLLWATAGLILLIACVNVTHLQLVRSMERQREIAIRKALGSSRMQVMQPVILEGLLLALPGGTAGVVLAFPTVRVLVAMAPTELPRASEIHLNGWVLAFTFGLAVMTAVAGSVLPALRAAKVEPAEALKRDTSRGVSRHGAAKLRDGLVIAEVTATFVLAVGAGLLLHTMTNLMARTMGYETSQMLVVDADGPAHSLQDALRVGRQFDELFVKLKGIPGVERVAGIMGLPTGAYGSNGYYQTKGGLPMDPAQAPSANFSVASPGYFQAMGIPLKRGREFSGQDAYESPFVAVISESLARRSFGGDDPVGKQIQCGLDSDKWMTVVGVVGDVRQGSPAEAPGPTLYMPLAQHPFYSNQIHIVVRTAVEPLSVMSQVQQAILRVNPLMALRFTTMDAMVNNSVASERFRAVLISCFAGMGLLLAMLGVYGTMAYSVAQRRFEIGLRMAFGAERRTILGTVLAHAARLACFGIAAGLVLSVALGRLVTSMLVGVGPLDPISLVAAALLLFLTALGAAFIPARVATLVNPVTALRAE